MTEYALRTSKTTVPGTRVKCPEDCRYRSKLAPFCGYCMMEILNRKTEVGGKYGKNETETAGQAGKEGL